MARMQNALTKQLTDEHERVDLKLREGEESVRKIRQQREETGVQLYGVQHQLARMQTTFERTHDNYNIVQRYRTEAERQHEILQRQYEGKKEEADEQLKRVLKAQEELNQLNRTLKQVEEYQDFVSILKKRINSLINFILRVNLFSNLKRPFIYCNSNYPWDFLKFSLVRSLSHIAVLLSQKR